MDLNSARAEVEKLFDEWYPHLVRYGKRLCREQANVEDCIQQVMLLFFRELRNDVVIPNPKAWTLVVLRREMIRLLRRQKAHVLFDDQWYSTLAAEEDQGVTVDVGNVDSFLSVLSPREAEVLLLRMNGLKYREIAGTLKIGANSVNRYLSRAITKIRAWRILAEDGASRTEYRETTQRQLDRQVE